MTDTDRAPRSGLGLSAAVVSLGTLTSRVFGLIRDVSIAYVFGASRVTDVFFLAYQIPSLFRKLLAEGALSSSVVPVYVEQRERRPEAADRLASAVFTWAVLGVGLLTLLGVLGADYLVTVVAPGFLGTPSFTLTVRLTRIMFPFLLLMSAAAVAMGVLHGRDVYAPSAFAPALFNVALIGSVLWLAPALSEDPARRVHALAVGVLVGGFFQFAIQWWWLGRDGLRLRWKPDLTVPGLGKVFRLMGPMVFGLAISQMIVFVDKIIASFLDPGNISHLYYSNRLFQFPFALIGIALGTVVLPRSSEHVSRDDLEAVADTARDSIGMMGFLMIPSAVGLALVGNPLIGLLFRSPEFDVTDQRLTFAVLFFALLGLVAYGFIRIFVSLCYSFQDTMGPVQATTLALIVNVVLDVILVLEWPVSTYRVCGLTLAGSVAVWLQAAALRRRLDRHLPDVGLVPWAAVGRYCLMTVPMALAVLPVLLTGWGFLSQVVVGTTVGSTVYLSLAHLWGEPYPRRLLRQLRDRWHGSSSGTGAETDA